MTVAHLSDLHLGYGKGAGGRGRAEDVVRVFEAAMARIAGLGAQLVVIAGDVFDHPNVTAPPIAAFSRAVQRLRERLPEVLVAVAAGARDTPLDPSRQGPIAVIGSLESVEAADYGDSAGADCRRHGHGHPGAAPRGRGRAGPEAEAGSRLPVECPRAARKPCRGREGGGRRPAAGWRARRDGRRGAVEPRGGHIPSARLGLRRARLPPYPCGDRAARSLFGLAGENRPRSRDKGFLTARLDTGAVRFWPVEARAAVSLAPVDATDGGTATAARRLSEALAGVPGGIDGKLLRVPVRGLSPEDLAALDRELLARVRRRVAELRVDALPPGTR